MIVKSQWKNIEEANVSKIILISTPYNEEFTKWSSFATTGLLSVYQPVKLRLYVSEREREEMRDRQREKEKRKKHELNVSENYLNAMMI